VRSLREATLSKLTGQFVHLILDCLFHSRMAIPDASHGGTTYGLEIRIIVEMIDGTVIPTASISLLPSWRSI